MSAVKTVCKTTDSEGCPHCIHFQRFPSMPSTKALHMAFCSQELCIALRKATIRSATLDV